MKINIFITLLLLVQLSLKAQKTRENPLLTTINQPIQFGNITAKDVENATIISIEQAKKSLASIYNSPPGKRTFANTILAIDDLRDKLSSVALPIDILLDASPDTVIQNAARRSKQQYGIFGNQITLDEKLYLAIIEYAKTAEALALKGPKQRFLKNLLDGYERNGFALSSAKRKDLQAINDNIKNLELEFDKNISSYKGQFLVKPADMAGLPADYINSRKKENDNYIITLDLASFSVFMKYAESDAMRKALLIKYFNRSADKNLDVLQNLLIQRDKKAKLLGFTTYAAYVASDRMVKTTTTVWDFENKLIDQVKEKTKLDIDELLEIKRKHLNDPTVKVINEWEKTFYNNKLMVSKYQVDAEVVEEYLSLNNVLDGLFKVTQQLFGLTYNEIKNPSVWQKDVRLFEVKDGDKLIGKFYLDLHPRDNKFTGASCQTISKGKKYGNTYQIPTVALICNFNSATQDKPALLSLRQAETFFHEFGHVLHSLLTTVELSGQSGISVKRDFAEAPSQIFENWVLNYDALKLFAKHYKTGEVLPQDLFKKMENAKNVGSGISASNQIFLGILDYTLHDKFDPTAAKTTTDIVKELQNKITPFEYIDGTNIQAAFGHLNSYGASYYSYLWSKVYAEDMFSIFEKNGIMDQKTGLEYRNKILANGGTKDELQMVKDFLGREPDRKAFLKSLGL